MSVSRARCCRGVQTLAARTAVESASDFRSAGTGAGFELFLPRNLARLPEDLHIEAHRFPRRIEAYWNGCVWVV